MADVTSRTLSKSMHFLEFALSWALEGSCGFRGFQFLKNDTKYIFRW